MITIFEGQKIDALPIATILLRKDFQGGLPEKTYAIYGTLHNPGETDYYQLTLNSNQMLELQLSVPDPLFMPTLVVMGPGIETRNVLPDSIKAPEGLESSSFPG